MHFDKFLKDMAPLASMVLANAARGYSEKAGFKASGKEAASLADLDLSGDAPHAVNLVGPDIVIITKGDEFTITLECDPDSRDQIRFMLEDGILSILRDGSNPVAQHPATINVTIPKTRKLILAGSGSIRSVGLAKKAEITIAGSGQVQTSKLKLDRLEVSILGTGTYHGSGVVQKLRVTLAGSGDADMAALKTEEAKISIIGSGNAILDSDGEVHAKIMGSGNVTVRGNARCKVKSFGSGTLVCEQRAETGKSG
jgi:hypothetical protein